MIRNATRSSPGGCQPSTALPTELDQDVRRAGARPVLALQPRSNQGHQFVIYGDSCSGVPGGRHEATFGRVNEVVARLSPPPEFVCFLGDEVVGLTDDVGTLRAQWRHWQEQEMEWLDQDAIPIYHTTGNHTTYDIQSENVYRDVLGHLPANGPDGQEGLSYFVRRDDLLLVFVNTVWSGFGIEGHVETDWLRHTLATQDDARFKLVLGHHPVFPTNGNAGPYQRTIEPRDGRQFWDILLEHGVAAYLCSHMLAFDVQVHDGVLQIMTAGAGTTPLMPPEGEYHHAVQAAIDDRGLRYQVLDEAASVREWLSWPLTLPSSSTWPVLDEPGVQSSPAKLPHGGPLATPVCCWTISGLLASRPRGPAQTLLAGWADEHAFAPVWIGIVGKEPFLAVILTAERGRSPHLWRGPALRSDERFEYQLCVHLGMGPGGVLWRTNDAARWTSMISASAWGPGRIPWPARWAIAHGYRWTRGPSVSRSST